MGLSIRARVAARDVDVELAVADGERVAVLGCNGAGKSTLLGLLAGTVRPDAGSCELGGRTLFARGEGRRRWVPSHGRSVGLVAQEPLLFPHLSVLDNVAFGARAAGVPRSAARDRGMRWLAEVGAEELAARVPGALSGGEAQRVAIARALAAEPELLLLDEPLSALDVAVASMVRRVLRSVLGGRTVLLATHDLLDALVLADRVAVLERGRVVEQGPADEVLTRPRSAFAARIAGLNLVRGVGSAMGVRTLTGAVVQGRTAAAAPDGAPLGEGEAPLREGEAAAAVFPPSAVGVFDRPPGGSPRNVFDVRVEELSPLGAFVRVTGVDPGGAALSADVTARSAAELDLHPGCRVTFAVKAASVLVYPC